MMTIPRWYEQLRKKHKVSLRELREWLDRRGWEAAVSHELTEEGKEALKSHCSYCYDNCPLLYDIRPCGHKTCPTCSTGPCPACGYRLSWSWPKVGRRHPISGSPFGG